MVHPCILLQEILGPSPIVMGGGERPSVQLVRPLCAAHMPFQSIGALSVGVVVGMV